jgi:membrane protease YdiL (CAAX protease family)
MSDDKSPLKPPTIVSTASPLQLSPLGWRRTVAVFGAAGLLLFVGTHVLIPWMREATGIEPILCWFIVGGVGVFTPLLVVACLLLQREQPLEKTPSVWGSRLRFRRMNRGDWLWGIGGLAVIGALSAGIQYGLNVLLGGMRMQPSFMTFDPLSPGRYWILAVWLPFWTLNLMSEEILWRGVVLPRQEVALGSRAWLANAFGWSLFHVAFGWELLVLLLPILVILPYVIQRRQNTWVAVIIHAGLNGPGFIAIAFGLV